MQNVQWQADSVRAVHELVLATLEGGSEGHGRARVLWSSSREDFCGKVLEAFHNARTVGGPSGLPFLPTEDTYNKAARSIKTSKDPVSPLEEI